MLETAQYPARLCAMLGLLPWRLRRDVAREISQTAAVPADANTAVAQAETAPAPAPARHHAPVSMPAEGLHVWAADSLTVISLPDYGSWWLPALSLQDGRWRLFRSDAEMNMLQMMLQATGLAALARHMYTVDAHFAAADANLTRLPPDQKELLSLPAPRLLCGAVAEQLGKAWNDNDGDTPLLLHHPLLLLQQPQYKRAAWQQLLAYRQVIHV